MTESREREPHVVRERHQMRRGKLAVTVLDQMQMLDQEIRSTRTFAEQRAHFLERARIDLAPLWSSRRFSPPAARLVVGGVNRCLSFFSLPIREGRIAAGDPGWVAFKPPAHGSRLPTLRRPPLKGR